MVQEIVHKEAELERLLLGDPEALVESQIGVEVAGSVNGRNDGRAVLADAGRRGETIRVNVLVLAEI